MSAGEVAVLVGALIPVFLALGAGGKYLFDRFWPSRKDAVQEWTDIAHRTQEQFDGYRLKTDARLDDQQMRLLTQSNEIVQLKYTVADCERDRSAQAVATTELKGQMALLQSVIQRLQTITGDEPPATLQPVTVIADMDGIIRTITPTVGPLLHWMPGDLIRKSVESLIPERLKDQHRKAMTALKASKAMPWPERVLVTEALTREGAEVPVTITLSGFMTGKDEVMLVADIRRRYSITQALAGTQVPVAVPPAKGG